MYQRQSLRIRMLFRLSLWPHNEWLLPQSLRERSSYISWCLDGKRDKMSTYVKKKPQYLNSYHTQTSLPPPPNPQGKAKTTATTTATTTTTTTTTIMKLTNKEKKIYKGIQISDFSICCSYSLHFKSIDLQSNRPFFRKLVFTYAYFFCQVNFIPSGLEVRLTFSVV